MRIIQTDYGKVGISMTRGLIVKNPQDALDLIGNLSYGGCSSFILFKENLVEDFFDLKTKIAGEILQKLVNYSIRLAIVGDFSVYNSKSLRDFIYESNNGKHVYFVSTVEEALKALNT